MNEYPQQAQSSVATAERTTRSRPPLLLDIYLGAIHGDYARQLGVAGYLTQAVCSFIPVVGQLFALRDLFADLGQHDGVGVVLNFLALIPVLGGFPKTFRILRAVRDLGNATRLMSNVNSSLRTP
jgi:hypothetical protein